MSCTSALPRETGLARVVVQMEEFCSGRNNEDSTKYAGIGWGTGDARCTLPLALD